MSWVDLSYLLTGAFLCLVVCGQIVLWTRLRWLSRQQGRTQLLAWQAANRRQLDQQAADARSRQNGATGEPLGLWQGWRQFRVAE
ncbi:MAG: hypothetical protein LW697_02115, partial [Blastopirellula sp.]|nr:hypothetical protein [Blastopirellula sp.]